MPLAREEAVEGREVWVEKPGRVAFRARISVLHAEPGMQFPWATLARTQPAGVRAMAYLAQLAPVVGDGSDEVRP